MAQDANGTPTSPDNIPTYNTASDAPSGKGLNAIVAAIQVALSNRISKPSGISVGEAAVWNGTGWDRSTVTKLSQTSLSGYPWKNSDIDPAAAIAYSKMANPGGTTTFLRADGTFAAPTVSTVYDRVTAAVDITNTTTETSMYTKSILANDMSTNKMLRLTLKGDWLKNTTDNLTLKIKFGGTTFYNSTVFTSNNVANAARFPWKLVIEVSNLGAANSQWIDALLTSEFNVAAPTSGIGLVDLGSSGGVRGGQVGISALGTIDTTANQTLDITGTWSLASASDSWRTRYALLELL